MWRDRYDNFNLNIECNVQMVTKKSVIKSRRELIVVLYNGKYRNSMWYGIATNKKPARESSSQDSNTVERELLPINTKDLMVHCSSCSAAVTPHV